MCTVQQTGRVSWSDNDDVLVAFIGCHHRSVSTSEDQTMSRPRNLQGRFLPCALPIHLRPQQEWFCCDPSRSCCDVAWPLSRRSCSCQTTAYQNISATVEKYLLYGLCCKSQLCIPDVTPFQSHLNLTQCGMSWQWCLFHNCDRQPSNR